MSEIIPIVDKNDKIIEYRERKLITKKDTYRISALDLASHPENYTISMPQHYAKLEKHF
jgi:hypothetical protein